MAGRVLRPFMGLLKDRRAGVSATLTLLLIPLIGVVGMATEASSWFLTQRAMQNAADSAAVAAAANGCVAGKAGCTTPYYNSEAFSVAKSFGFETGVADATVAASNTALCPSGDSNCYSVTITKKVPFYLVRLVGFTGDTTVAGGAPAQTVRAYAVASPRGAATGFCIIGLGGGDAVRINGGPGVDLSGCDIRSNGNAVCNGANSDTGINYGYAVGTSNCGVNEVPNAPVLADPFAYLNANPPIPTISPTCNPNPATVSTLTQADFASATVTRCGNYALGGPINVPINVTTGNTVLTIYNGFLDLKGRTLQTTGSGSLTIIFTGTSPPQAGKTYEHILKNTSGNGVVDIAAPTSGALSGIAIYQDGRLNNARNIVNFTYNGNNPTLNIQGLIYLPRAAFQVSGAINLHSGGLSCLGVVANSVLINGNGSVFDNATSQCLQAGLTLPTIPGTSIRQTLVQ